MLTELWPLAAKHGVKFVLNAGGLNPEGARQAIAKGDARQKLDEFIAFTKKHATKAN